MAQYNYPNARNNANAGIPVYLVAAPVLAPGVFPPNKQNNPLGAIPIRMMAGPPAAPNSGAIPVIIVGGPGPGPKWPSDQRQAAGAIPVYNSLAPNAMPVWQAIPVPAPPIVIDAEFYTNTSLNVGQDVGTVTAYNNPTGWAIVSGNPIGQSGGPMFVITYSGRIVLFNGPISIGVINLVVQATNADGTGTGLVTIQCLQRK